LKKYLKNKSEIIFKNKSRDNIDLNYNNNNDLNVISNNTPNKNITIPDILSIKKLFSIFKDMDFINSNSFFYLGKIILKKDKKKKFSTKNNDK